MSHPHDCAPRRRQRAHVRVGALVFAVFAVAACAGRSLDVGSTTQTTTPTATPQTETTDAATNSDATAEEATTQPTGKKSVAASCAEDHGAADPTTSEAAFIERLLGVWAVCPGASSESTLAKLQGIEFTEDGMWYRLTMSGEGYYRANGVSDEGRWAYVDGYVSIAQGDRSFNIAATFESGPRRMYATETSGASAWLVPAPALSDGP